MINIVCARRSFFHHTSLDRAVGSKRFSLFRQTHRYIRTKKRNNGKRCFQVQRHICTCARNKKKTYAQHVQNNAITQRTNREIQRPVQWLMILEMSLKTSFTLYTQYYAFTLSPIRCTQLPSERTMMRYSNVFINAWQRVNTTSIPWQTSLVYTQLAEDSDAQRPNNR